MLKNFFKNIIIKNIFPYFKKGVIKSLKANDALNVIFEQLENKGLIILNNINSFKDLDSNDRTEIFDTAVLNYELITILKNNHQNFISKHDNYSNRPKLNCAIFGILPPEESGIAIYNAKTFGINENYHVFSYFSTFSNHLIAKNSIGSKYCNNFFPINLFSFANKLFEYEKKIFILGNSYQNIPYFEAAIKEKNKQNSYLYLHEINMHNLLYSFFEFPFYYKILSFTYPEYLGKLTSFSDISYTDIKKTISYGIRAVLLLTGITNIIVNNEYAKNMLFDEIKDTPFENTLSITILFHPFNDFSEENKINISDNIILDDNEINVGSFGLCDDYIKSTDIIVKAIALINEKYGVKAKCILAGYNAEYYINNNVPELFRKYVIAFSKLSDIQFYLLMKQIDIYIQLRNFPHGESSGSVFDLLTLKKKVIASENFIDNRFEKFCIIVSHSITADDLSKKIIYCINEKTIENDIDSIIDKYGYKNLSDAILNL